LTGKPYRQAVEESRKAYEKTAKEYPKTTFASELVGGAASSFIPGVGALGRGAQIAAATTKAAKLGQIARGGAQVGALDRIGCKSRYHKAIGNGSRCGIGSSHWCSDRCSNW